MEKIKANTEYYYIDKMGTTQYYIIWKYFIDECYDIEGNSQYRGITRHVSYSYQMYDMAFRKLEPNGAYKVAGSLNETDYNAITTSGHLHQVNTGSKLARLMLVGENENL